MRRHQLVLNQPHTEAGDIDHDSYQRRSSAHGVNHVSAWITVQSSVQIKSFPFGPGQTTCSLESALRRRGVAEGGLRIAALARVSKILEYL